MPKKLNKKKILIVGGYSFLVFHITNIYLNKNTLSQALPTKF